MGSIPTQYLGLRSLGRVRLPDGILPKHANVERWRPDDERPETLADTLVWRIEWLTQQLLIAASRVAALGLRIHG